MKRKWLAALLALTMTAGLLAGCGGSGNAGSTNTTATDTPAAEADTQEESGGVIRKRLRLRQKAKRQLVK